MANPKCPTCNTEGIEKFENVESKQGSKNGEAWFEAIYCSECGHVYGILAKIVHSPKVPKFPDQLPIIGE